MKRTFIDRMLSGLAVVSWMAVIFLFSAQTGNASSQTSGGIVSRIVALIYPGFDSLPSAEQLAILDIWQTVVRKCAHFCAYALLGALALNAIRTYGIRKYFKYGISVGMSAIYAVSDELHQHFVPGRSCQLLDVCIDTAGAAFGAACFMLMAMWIRRRKHA